MKLYQWVMPILGLLLIPMSASAKTEETSSLSEIVGKASGMQTKITEDGVVRLGWPRQDVAVTVDGMSLAPPAGLGSWAAFKPAHEWVTPSSSKMRSPQPWTPLLRTDWK